MLSQIPVAKIVACTIELDQQAIRREFDAAHKEMTDVFSIMRVNIARRILWIFELPLNDKMGPIGVIRVLLGKRGCVVVAIGRSGNVVRVEPHRSHGLEQDDGSALGCQLQETGSAEGS
jgi:hypothetical protein